MQRIGIKFVSGMILLCAIAGVLAGFTSHTGNQKSSESVKDHSGESLELLYSLGMAELDSSLHLTVKLQGQNEMKSNDNNEEAVQSLARGLGLKDVTVDLENGERAFRARGRIYDMDVRMDWVVSRGQNYVKIQFDTERSYNFQKLIEYQERAVSLLDQAGITPAWNASVQGNVNNGLSAGETIKQIEEAIGMKLSLDPVDSYQDIATESRSYEVPSLPTYVKSGEQLIHMQVAVHEDSMNKNNRITIGFPVITVEY